MIRGITGEQGDKGESGLTGEEGDKGIKGITGNDAIDGESYTISTPWKNNGSDIYLDNSLMLDTNNRITHRTTHNQSDGPAPPAGMNYGNNNLIVNGNILSKKYREEKPDLRFEYGIIKTTRVESQNQRPPANPNYRLVGGVDGPIGGRHLGNGVYEGRLEYKIGNNWGTVCDDWWYPGDRDPNRRYRVPNNNVACKTLGFNEAVGVSNAQTLTRYKINRGSIHLDNVKCNGSENSLDSCQASRGAHNCGHREDIVLKCR